jgi:hypothetical protein
MSSLGTVNGTNIIVTCTSYVPLQLPATMQCALGATSASAANLITGGIDQLMLVSGSGTFVYFNIKSNNSNTTNFFKNISSATIKIRIFAGVVGTTICGIVATSADSYLDVNLHPNKTIYYKGSSAGSITISLPF